jgi:predicted enzyme related to lactoylglutathione lyase
MPNPPGSFIWYELMSPDVDGSKTFYDAVVGWSIETSSTFPNGYRMIGREDGKFAGGVMPLTDEMRAHGARPVWLGYIGVAGVDAIAKEIEEDGGSVLMPPFDIPNVGRVAMVTGPEGAPFYLMDPIPPEGDPNASSDVFSVDQPQHVRWNELWSSDPRKSVDFYTSRFGWVQNGDMDMGEMGKYQFFELDGTMIGAVMRTMPDLPQSMWNFYIGVDDIDRAAEAVKAGGGRVDNGPMEIPGGDYAVNAVDPQGALFGLVGPRKA